MDAVLIRSPTAVQSLEIAWALPGRVTHFQLLFSRAMRSRPRTTSSKIRFHCRRNWSVATLKAKYEDQAILLPTPRAILCMQDPKDNLLSFQDELVASEAAAVVSVPSRRISTYCVSAPSGPATSMKMPLSRPRYSEVIVAKS